MAVFSKLWWQKDRANIRVTGFRDSIDLILGDAAEVIHKINGPFDLIFQDSDKTLYPVMLDRCIELVRVGGMILADDALFKPMKVREELGDPVHHYLQEIFADRRLYNTILPIGDGLALSVKIAE